MAISCEVASDHARIASLRAVRVPFGAHWCRMRAAGRKKKAVLEWLKGSRVRRPTATRAMLPNQSPETRPRDTRCRGRIPVRAVRFTLDKLAHQNAYQLAGYPDSYPDALFQNVVDVIIEMSEMHLPKWIANKGVKPKWNMT